jgi:ATP-dependent Clp protease ATP-binding subunit ClpC
MEDTQFSDELNGIFRYIQETLLKEYDTEEISIYHFIVASIQKHGTISNKILNKILFSDNITQLNTDYRKILSQKLKRVSNERNFDTEFKNCIRVAKWGARHDKVQQTNSGHMLSAILSINNDVSRDLKNYGVSANEVKRYVSEETQSLNGNKEVKDFTPKSPVKHSPKKKTAPPQTKANITPTSPIMTAFVGDMFGQMPQSNGIIEQNSTSINDLVKTGNIDEYYGNEEKYEILYNILSKRHKNNVIVTGGSGVGKTHFVKNLAHKIVHGECPKQFADKTLIEIDILKMLENTAMRGVFESKVTMLLDEAERQNKYIFLIDDIFGLFNSTSSKTECESFIINALKRPNIMVICTCSDSEYNKNILPNRRVCQYFTQIKLEECTEEECLEILKLHAQKLSHYHAVEYDEDSMTTAMKLAKRYISERQLPESAIDILDECGAKMSLLPCTNENLQEAKTRLEELQEKIKRVTPMSKTKRELSELDKLKLQEIELQSIVDNIYKNCNLNKTEPTVTSEIIKTCISKMTDIPVTDVDKDEKEKLKGLSPKIKQYVVGQDEAVDSVCKAVRRQRVGISNPDKPVVLLMAGSTGVGKTYLAKMLAKEVFGSEKKLVRLDMSEYSDKTAGNKLIGSSSGYIGYENGGILTEAIKSNKHCVLLLDEIEKADEEVHNMLLSLFDDGRLTDNKGYVVDFKNVIIIMTSNIGARESEEMGNGIGFNVNVEENKKSIISKEIKRKFKPEFINRIDKIIYFNKLTEENFKTIIRLEIKKVEERINEIGYYLDKSVTENEMVDLIYNNVRKESKYGARPVIREVQNNIIDTVTNLVIDNDYEQGHIFNYEELTQEQDYL